MSYKAKQILIGYLWLLAISGIYAQVPSQEIEKLMKTIKESKGPAKVDAYSDLSFQYFRIDPSRGIFYGKRALKIADSMKLPAAKCKAYNSLGINYFAVGKLDSAKLNLNKARHCAKVYKDTLQDATAYGRLGVVFEKEGKFDSALFVFQKALQLFKLLRNCEKMGTMHENLGTIHLHRGEKKSALEQLLRADALYDSCNIDKPLPQLYIKIGRIYAETDEANIAYKWYEKGKEAAQKSGDLNALGIALNAIGILQKIQGKNQEALQTFKNVLALTEKTNNSLLLQAALANIANVYFNLKDFHAALHYHRKAMQMAEKANNPLLKAQRQVGMAEAYLELKDYENAIYYLQSAIRVMEASKAASDLILAYKDIIRASKELGQLETAVTYLEKLTALQDSLNKHELNFALDSLKVKFNTEKTLQDNAMLLQQSETQKKTIFFQKTILLIGLLAFALLIMFFIFIIQNRKKIKKANKLLKEKNEEIRSRAIEMETKNQQLHELSRYKDRMNSFLVHDLKNPLNSLMDIEPGALTAQQAESIKQSARQMLNIVNNILDISKLQSNALLLCPEEISLAEIVHLAFNETAYFARQKSIRMIIQFTSDFRVKADKEVIKRVLVNLLTNAIKFSSKGGTIRVMTQPFEESKIKVIVKDEGEGITPEFLPFVFNEYTQHIPRKVGFSASTGIGLTFCKLAIEAHGGEIGVISEPTKGSSFWFTLPSVAYTDSDGSERSPEVLLIENNPVISLNLEEKNYLRPFCKALQKTNVYQITEAKSILKSVEPLSENISLWKSKVLQAISECNENQFQEIINISNDESL